MPMYWGSMTNQNSTNQNSDALDRACKLLCDIPEGLFRDFSVPVYPVFQFSELFYDNGHSYRAGGLKAVPSEHVFEVQ